MTTVPAPERPRGRDGIYPATRAGRLPPAEALRSRTDTETMKNQFAL